ncbi:hypothetical protein ACFQ3R_09940 [Mesonia ostreae]|uniref:Glycosyl transferase family 28 C-terminal domain-containing protein n=1 Tax=Mesonia ostreae TaxID=861110 RepID=A0ABU2KE91_9FLAO|nr:hypothetical protein [Mesonia ostreae]MDT0293014.1 hypothetical protein [Mesonia ostreae]
MIAYYAHSIGSGHSNCGQEFCKVFKNRALVITTSNFKFDEDIKVITIEGENVTHSEYLKTTHNLPKYAHFLPKDHLKILFRNFKILESCISEHINFAVIDVSVETALQFRIAGIPYAYHKMLGNRDDVPHQIAFEASEFLFALYPVQMETETRKSLLKKIYHIGFISRFPFKKQNLDININLNSELKILIILSSETKLSSTDLHTLCNQMKNSQFSIISNLNVVNIKNATLLDYTRNLKPIILNHDIVIASCGLNMTSELLALKNKFIAIAENRYYDEHLETLKGLKKNNLAVELDVSNLKKTITEYLELPEVKNLKSYFGTMDSFKKIKILQPYLLSR